MFSVTKENSPMGKVLWYDGELYHSHTVNNETYPLFVQVGPGLNTHVYVNYISICIFTVYILCIYMCVYG